MFFLLSLLNWVLNLILFLFSGTFFRSCAWFMGDGEYTEGIKKIILRIQNGKVDFIMRIRKVFVWFLSVLLLISCSNNQAVKPRSDTITSGVIHISVDETFKPVIDSQIKVFESLFSKSKIIAHYKPEAECIKDLLNDSIRMVIITRGLKNEEEKFLKDTLRFNAVQGKMAYDAIAVVVNTSAKDSIFDMAEIRSIVKGTSGYKFKVVMDGLSATSTVRYAIDSLLNGHKFGTNVMAATSSEGVID